MRIHRLIAILLFIESRERVKARDLAEALETSLRTIRRDIATLCEAGIPITTTTGPHGGISLMEGYTTNIDHLHCDDVISLFLSGTGIRPDEHSEAGIKLKQALLKLEKTLPAPYAHDIRIAKERFYFDPTPWWQEKVSLPFLDVLRKSVWQSKKITVLYRKANGEASTRCLEPYGLVVKGMVWYLIGRCEKACDIRMFRCDRLIKVEISEESFAYPESFKLEDFWRKSSQSFKDSCDEAEYYPVRVKLPLKYGSCLSHYTVINQAKEGGYITATLNLYKPEYAKEDILELVGRAEVLNPPELREHVKTCLAHISALYI
ncbi:MAG: YafY family transcriptional regulator [Clostridia bacterium]|nr:YafY family transcriptional regulator [Clostridia bacterium]